MTARFCSRCKLPGGKGPRELRPYGARGEDVCAECTFGKKADPAVLREAEKQLGKRLATKEPLILVGEEQVGRPLILVGEEQVGPRPFRRDIR